MRRDAWMRIFFLVFSCFLPVTHAFISQWTIAVHLGAHDNTMVISKGPTILLVLELERIFGVRYFAKSHQQVEFRQQWGEALAIARKTVFKPSFFEKELTFSTAIFVQTDTSTLESWMMATLREVIPAKRWLEKPHQQSHATHAFYDSPFPSALIVTADSDMRDGAFSVWWGTRSKGLVLLEKLDISTVLAFEYVGAAMHEMNGGKPDLACWVSHPLRCNKYAGTLMGYAALGNKSDVWMTQLQPLFSASSPQLAAEAIKRLIPFPTDPEEQRTIAASAQALFEDTLVQRLQKHAGRLLPKSGVVLGGDLALNVRANTAVQLRLARRTWVPCNPGDDGVAVGAIWMHHAPMQRQELMYLGLPVQDLDRLPTYAAKYNSTSATAESVAQLILADKVVGIMRGRQEVGPRALGHRSLFARPTSEMMKKRLNRIKDRQWFRPVAPTLNVEAVQDIFEEAKDLESPYMSFAPKMKKSMSEKFPAIWHYDGSARPQTVSKKSEPWLHRLLALIGAQLGQPVVINTSFNTKGRPIINTVADGLDLLKTLADLDYLLVEDTLFRREDVLRVKE